MGMGAGTPALLPRALAIALVMAACGALVMSWRIATLGEAISVRTQILVILGGTGGFMAGLAGGIAAGWLSRRIGWHVLMPLCLILAYAAFVASFAASFAIENRYIHGQFENPPFSRHWYFELLLSPAAGMGMFLQTGTKYMMPWPAAILSVIFTGLARGVFRRNPAQNLLST
jgi:MFS family permease